MKKGLAGARNSQKICTNRVPVFNVFFWGAILLHETHLGAILLHETHLRSLNPKPTTNNFKLRLRTKSVALSKSKI